MLNSKGSLRDIVRRKNINFDWSASVESGTLKIDLTNSLTSDEDYFFMLSGSVGNRQVKLVRSVDLPWLNLALPIGFVADWVHPTPPYTWLERDGASLSRFAYPELFSVLGYSYGGSGEFFNLPDDRGKFTRGWDNTGTVDIDRGGTGFYSLQNHQFLSHSHDKASYARNYVTSGGGLTPAEYYDGAYHGRNTLNAGGSETRPINTVKLKIIKAWY